MSDEEPDWLAYRFVYGAAWRFVEGLRYREIAHYRVDADDPTLRARTIKAVRDELGDAIDSIDPDVTAEAIDDALNGRRPRC